MRPEAKTESVDWSFRTDKVIARLVDTEDRWLYRALYTNAQVMAHIGSVLTEFDADRLFDNVLVWNAEAPMRARYWRLECKVEETAIGVAALVSRGGAHEIGLMLLPASQRTGVGLQVTQCIRDASMSGQWGDGIQTLTLQPRVENLASIRLCEHLGFPLIERNDQRIFWRMTRDDWRNFRQRPSGVGNE